MTETVEKKLSPAEQMEAAEAAFINAVDAGKERVEVLDAMYEASGMAKMALPTIYGMFADKHGKQAAKTAKGKAPEAFAILDKHLKAEGLEDEAMPAAKAAAQAEIESALEVSKATAVTYIREWAKANEIDLPKVPSKEREKSEKAIARETLIKAALDAGKTRQEILAQMVEELDLTEKSAASSYQLTLKNNGWTSNGSGGRQGTSSNRTAALDWLVTHRAENGGEVNRKAAMEHMTGKMEISTIMARQYLTTFDEAVRLAPMLAA